MPELFGTILDGGSFALVAWLVIQQFRRLDAQMDRSAEREDRTAKVIAELVLQVARLTGASTLEIRESMRIAGKDATA